MYQRNNLTIGITLTLSINTYNTAYSSNQEFPLTTLAPANCSAPLGPMSYLYLIER